jgi:hypothetical protein
MGKDLTKYLIPREGLIVRNPSTMFPISAAGAELPWTGPLGRHWRRRVKVGDMTIGKPPLKSEAGKIKRNQGKEEK